MSGATALANLVNKYMAEAEAEEARKKASELQARLAALPPPNYGKPSYAGSQMEGVDGADRQEAISLASKYDEAKAQIDVLEGEQEAWLRDVEEAAKSRDAAQDQAKIATQSSTKYVEETKQANEKRVELEEKLSNLI